MKVVKKVDVPPIGQNRLSIALARKIKAIMRARGEDLNAAATKMGLDAGHLYYIVLGRVVPKAIIAERILGWMRGVDYSNIGPPAVQFAAKDNLGWQLIKTRMPPELVGRLRIEAKRQSVSIGTLVHIAIERLLDNRPFLTTMKEAKKLVEKQRILQAFRSVPTLRDILDFDLASKIESGSAKAPTLLPVEKLLNENVLDLNTDQQLWEEV